jgi:hypothetical protein
LLPLLPSRRVVATLLQGDWKDPTFKKRYFILRRRGSKSQRVGSDAADEGAELTWYRSQEDAGLGSPARGSLDVANMKIEDEAGIHTVRPLNPLEPRISIACFALLPANIPANQAHLRRIVCGGQLAPGDITGSSRERKKWCETLRACVASVSQGGNAADKQK